MGPNGVKTFNGCGGSIGRVAGNEWVLPDVERYLSSRHCAVHFRDGAYYLEDTSTNGVYVNAASEPLGKGQSLLLHDGDRLGLGDYEIAVEIARAADFGSHAGFASESDPFTVRPITNSNAAITSPTHPTNSNFQSRVDLPVTDPLALLGKSDVPTGSDWAAGNRGKTGSSSAFFPEDDDFLGGFPNTTGPQRGSGSQADNLPADAQFFQPPAARNEPSNEMIPDDWDLTTGFSAPAAAAQAAPVNAPVTPTSYPGSAAPLAPRAEYAPPISPAPFSPAQPSPPPVAAAVGYGNDASLLRAFLEGAGIADLQIAPEQGATSMHILGQMTREMVQGMIEMLMARASLKSEFRMPMTVIRPVENNPLKFCVTADDALRTMLIKQGGGYLPPLEAVRDGFADIKGHQMALMAGMQAAFEALLRRFNPQEVEQQADKGSKLGGLLPAGKKARSWELYSELYKVLAREAEDNFQALLGEEFARAYEEQIQKIDKLRS